MSLSNLTLHEIHNHLANLRKRFVSEEQMNDEPYAFKDVNTSCLFSKYQNVVSSIIERHSCPPIEFYVHELASLNHTFFLCEGQHIEIAQKRHYKCQFLLSIGRFYDYHHCHYQPRFRKESKGNGNSWNTCSGYKNGLWIKAATCGHCQSVS